MFYPLKIDKLDWIIVIIVSGFLFMLLVIFLVSGRFSQIVSGIKFLSAFNDSAFTARLKSKGMDTCLLPVVCCDSKGITIYVNKRFEDVFGWKEEEIEGKDFSLFIMTKEMRIAHKKGLNEYFLNGRDLIVENYTGVDLPAIRKDGSNFPVKLFAQKFKDDKNDYFIGLMMDQTKQVARQKETDFRLDLYSNSEKINKSCSWRLDILNNNTQGSENFYYIYDTEKKPGNHRYGEAVLNEDRPKLEKIVKEAIDNCKDFEITYRVYHRIEGMQTILCKGKVESDDNGKSIFIYGHSQVIETRSVI